MTRVLLTCFEPFDGKSINASQEVARAVAVEKVRDTIFEVLPLPVVRYLAIDIAIRRIEETRPDLVVMLGEDGKRDVVSLERVAENLDDFRIPDNAGNQPRAERIIEGASEQYFSTLPLDNILRAVEFSTLPIAVSDSAGAFLCNHLFFGVRHAMELAANPVPAGFIHVPRFPEQVAGAGTGENITETKGLAREKSTLCARIAIGVSIGSLPARKALNSTSGRHVYFRRFFPACLGNPPR